MNAARPPRLLLLGKFCEGSGRERGWHREDHEDRERWRIDLAASRSLELVWASARRPFFGGRIASSSLTPGLGMRPPRHDDEEAIARGTAAAAPRAGAPSRCTPALLLLSILACCLAGGVSATGLEATLIAVDLSGFMVNGDYAPSRLQCQYECVNLITTVKLQNPESAVGLMSMSCREEECPRVHIAPAMDSEQHDVLSKLHTLNQRPANYVQFEKAIEVSICQHSAFLRTTSMLLLLLLLLLLSSCPSSI